MPDDAPTPPASPRLKRAREALAGAELDALLVGPGPDLRYLCGYDAPPLERLTMLVLPASGAATLIVPALEQPRAEAADLPEEITVTALGEGERGTDAVLAALDRELSLEVATSRLSLGVDDALQARFLLALQTALPQATWSRGSAVVAPLRRVKDAEEVAALRAAGAAIDRVHARMGEFLVPGRSEREAAARVAAAITEEGHEHVSFVIVGAGPNGASPHHEPGDRILAEGDAVVVDIGGLAGGYASDCTRNYLLGTAPEGYADAEAAVRTAQRAGCDVVRPGVRAGEVDAAANAELRARGYQEWMLHRTGHGIGVETHEEPYLVETREPDADTVLAPGMAFSVEPGVYASGRFGVRIEDIVVVTEDGCEPLNNRPHGAVTLPASAP